MAVQYWIDVHHDYLGKYRRVTGRSPREVEIKAAEQLHRWNEQAARAQLRQAANDAREAALEATEEAQGLIAAYRGLLASTLAIDDRIDWNSLLNLREFSVPKPKRVKLRRPVVPPKRSFAERFSRRLVEQREAAEAAAAEQHKAAETAAAKNYEAAVKRWEQDKSTYDRSREEHNASIHAFRAAYERGEPEAVEQYVSLVLASSALPEGLERECAIRYIQSEKCIIVDAVIPPLSRFPSVASYRFVASRSALEQKLLSQKERTNLYDDAIIKLALRTLHEIFEGDYAQQCNLVVLNGIIEDVDPGTGKDFSACVLSLQATREQFEDIDLSRVDPAACFRLLKGISGSRLANMQAVQPIRVMNTDDARFIEADGVLSELAADENLMTMPWQDFEVLVRDLFESMFASRQAEVRVTRTSRDQGVDAVVFDPDPLMGGKTVIQAKRYTKTVPVAAVRELYGTMLNEGAGKGILVATSHYGATAREFAKDKPLTLVDGPQLLHLLLNSGHRVRIDPSETAQA